MFYFLLTLALIFSITGIYLLTVGTFLFGGIALFLGIVFFTILFLYYRNKLKNCTPDCTFFDCDTFDCGGPDCG